MAGSWGLRLQEPNGPSDLALTEAAADRRLHLLGDSCVPLPMTVVANVRDEEVTELAPVLGRPDEFCRALHARLVGSLCLYLGDAGLAEELAQDAFVRVIERWPSVSTMAAPEAWTYRVAFNLANSRLRRRMAEHRAHQRDRVGPVAACDVDVAEVVAVRAAIADLPPRQRRAVILRFYGDLSIDQVAAAMGCRPGTVKAHLHQAMTSLRAAGLTAPDDVRRSQEDPS